MKYGFFLLVLCSMAFFTGCELDEGGASGTVTGSITNTGGYEDLKIGFFENFGENEGLDYDTIPANGTSEQGFLYYSDADDLSEISIEPVTFITVSGNTYSFDLPSDAVVSDVENTFEYRFAIWNDEDNNDMLDLVDISWFDVTSANAGELSRIPLRELGGTDPAYIHTWTFNDGNNGYEGYKYAGYDGVTNYTIELSDGNGGFDFFVY